MARLAGLVRFSVSRRPSVGRRAPSRVRHARVTITALALATLAIAVASTAAVERHRLAAIDGEYAQRRELLRARLADRPDYSLVLVAGSSRLVMGFTPEQLPPLTEAGRPVLAFNFSHYGAGPILTGVSLRRLFADGVRPRAVVLELMPAFLARENAALVSSLCTAGDAAAAGRYYANGELYWEYLRGRAVGLPGLTRRALWQVDSTYPLGPCGGYAALKDDVTPDERARHTAAQVPHFARLLRDWTPSPGADRAVRELVATCRAQGAAVRFVITPEGPANRAMYGPGCRDRVTAYAAGLAQDLDVPLTDARNWLEEEDFADSHHVLKRGAAKFTERLGREAIRPALNQ